MNNSRVERNRRKFYFKHGFDIAKYADAQAAGLSRQETAEYLGVQPEVIEAFENKGFK